MRQSVNSRSISHPAPATRIRRHTHEGEEFGIVLKGELELTINDKVHVVRENESFYFTSQTPHNWNNKSKEDAIVVWVITPPTF